MKLKDIVTLNSKVIDIDLSSKSINTKEIIMYVHTIDEENLNGLTFTLNSTKKYMHTLVDKPVVMKMDSSENDFKGHEPVYDSSGKIVKLDTIPVGTITDVWIEDRQFENETKKALMAKATIWSYKFPTVVEVMQKLIDNENLDTSVEVAIFSYTEDSTIEHRKTIEIEYLSNCMLGSLILPADTNAGVVEMFYREVAQALNQNKPDINKSSLNINSTKDGGVVMLSHEQIKEQLRSLINPNNNEAGSWQMDYYMWDSFTYDDHCVVASAKDSKWYRFDYEIQNETTVALVGEPKEQVMTFTDAPEGETEANELFVKLQEQESKINELSTTVEQKETELNEKVSEIEKLNTDLESAQKELSTKDEALKTTKTEANEKIIKLGESIDELKVKLSEVEPVVEEYNKVQAELAEKAKQEKIEQMKKFALNSKVITEKELTEDETIKQMIEELNEKDLKSLIADRIVEANSKEVKTELNTDVTITVSEGKDLIPQDLTSEMYAKAKRN